MLLPILLMMNRTQNIPTLLLFIISTRAGYGSEKPIADNICGPASRNAMPINQIMLANCAIY